MNNIYKYILKNKTLDNLILGINEGKNIVIIKENNEIDSLIDHLSEFIINYADENRLLDLIGNLDKKIFLNNIKLNKFAMLQREIDSNKESILNIFRFFNKKGYMNYSLNDLYSITNKSIEFKDKEFEYYLILSKSDVIKNNEKDIIIERVNNLLSNKTVNAYIKYRKFENSNKFNIIREDINIDDLNHVINKLGGIVNNIFAFTPPIYFNEYTNDFERNSIYYNNYSSDQIRNIANETNKLHNEYIFKDIVELKWYKISHIINYRKIKRKNNFINEEYIKLENIIYNQYLENIDNLKMFINSFQFIKKVCKDDVLDKINKLILNEEELYNYIKNIKRTLIIYKEYMCIKEELDVLEDLDRDILSFHYEKLKDTHKLSELLTFIPTYYLYNEIDSIEDSNIDIINSYSNIYYKFKRLEIALSSYKDLLLEVIRNYRNKNLYEFIENNEIGLQDLNYSDLIKEKYSLKNLKILFKLYPILVVDNYEYFNHEEDINNCFDLIIKSSDFLIDDNLKEFSYNKATNESLDKSITHLLLNLGYNIIQNENDISTIYIYDYNGDNNKKILYINNKDFNCDDLIDVLDLCSYENEVNFIWYRNWWLNRNEEIQRIQELLNS